MAVGRIYLGQKSFSDSTKIGRLQRSALIFLRIYIVHKVYLIPCPMFDTILGMRWTISDSMDYAYEAKEELKNSIATSKIQMETATKI